MNALAKTVIAAMLVFSWSLGALAQEKDAFLPQVKRILFLGDSITYDGKYVAAFEAELLLQMPKRTFEILSCGLPSETVSGLSEEGHAGGKFPRPDVHERLERVLAKIKPDLVFACYGMNDGIYLPLGEERFRKFKEGMIKLHDKVQAAEAKIVHLTPPVFDAEPIRKRVAPAGKVTANAPFEGYDNVLERYSAWLLGQRDKGWQVIDLHGPMKDALARERKTNAQFTFAGDGVHPSLAGHLVLARALMKGLPVPFDPGTPEFGDPLDAAARRGKLQKLVHQRQRILTDAWLTATGHKRPLQAGLPLDQAASKAEELNRQIKSLLAAK